LFTSFSFCAPFKEKYARNGKLAERRRRKATGLKPQEAMTAELPKAPFFAFGKNPGGAFHAIQEDFPKDSRGSRLEKDPDASRFEKQERQSHEDIWTENR
jgi:hypothetical protein